MNKVSTWNVSTWVKWFITRVLEKVLSIRVCTVMKLNILCVFTSLLFLASRVSAVKLKKDGSSPTKLGPIAQAIIDSSITTGNKASSYDYNNTLLKKYDFSQNEKKRLEALGLKRRTKEAVFNALKWAAEDDRKAARTLEQAAAERKAETEEKAKKKKASTDPTVEKKKKSINSTPKTTNETPKVIGHFEKLKWYIGALAVSIFGLALYFIWNFEWESDEDSVDL